MSLSQKHEGKVLVPWFNLHEWKTVHNYIYSENKNWDSALQILKLWKLRTPLLSAGVEGTLIILEALLVKSENLSTFEISQILSTSLMRFLNLCAANSDKQGSFYKTAMKNDLPNWIVTIRHEIAHSTKVPSRSMLELSLSFCLNWLKDKYWDIQHISMSDFDIEDNLNIADLIYVYSILSQKIYEPAAIYDEAGLRSKMNSIFKGLHKKQLNDGKMLDIVCKKIKEIIILNGKVTERIVSELFNSSFILPDEDDFSDRSKLPRSSIMIWGRLVDILHECEVLEFFVYKLYEFINDNRNDSESRNIASYWIYEIYKGLIHSKKKNGLQFTSNNLSMKNKKFANEILNNPGCSHNLNFVEAVLKYNDAPSDFIEDSVKLISSSIEQPKVLELNGILTVDNLNLNIIEENTIQKEQEYIVERKQTTRWIRIEDTSSFQNVPIGVLPHQSRHINPVLFDCNY